ncbi:ATP-binding protein [Kitasatospora sp. LaBMicrA B282]|uniref:ATP-binding protein n=1 Tax=Kitasatospora sp. LaBMicrA B282 TaxID=3420949 RepID=UPI003D121719
MTTHRRTFAGHPRELSTVRGWIRKLLNDHPRADEAQLIVSELSTNAVQHTESGRQARTFEVALVLAAWGITITVTDAGTSASSPRVQHSGVDSIRGRGLDIVAALADRFTIAGDRRGRAITTELLLPQQRIPAGSEGAPVIAERGYRCEYWVPSLIGPQLVNVFNTASAEGAIRWVRRSVKVYVLRTEATDSVRLCEWTEAGKAAALHDLRNGLPCTITTGQADQYREWSARPVNLLPLLPPPGKPVVTYWPICSRAHRRSELE